MSEEEIEQQKLEIRKLELERSHQCSIEFGRGTKNVMTYKVKQYYSPGMEKGTVITATDLKKELDKLCEVKVIE